MAPNRLFVACGKSSLPPDMVVGKKQKVFYYFFPHVNSDWIAKEQVLSGSRPSRGISHSGLSRNAAAAAACNCGVQSLRYVVH